MSGERSPAVLRLVGARTLATTIVLAGALIGAWIAAVQVLRVQARIARRDIGKALGEQAHRADRLYKKKYGDTIQLLVLGDSIAAGLGAETARQTLGAQLARRAAKRTHRAVRLHTAAVVGAETSMLRAQLAGLPAGYAPDVAVIIVGGNDVTHRVRLGDSISHLADAVTALQARGSRVVVGTCPDLSALAPVPQPLRSLGGVTSRRLAEAQRAVVTDLGARSVPLGEVVGPFFVAKPEEMFAVDRFHPSGAGYRRTAKALLPSVLAALGDAASPSPDHADPGADAVTAGRAP